MRVGQEGCFHSTSPGTKTRSKRGGERSRGCTRIQVMLTLRMCCRSCWGETGVGWGEGGGGRGGVHTGEDKNSRNNKYKTGIKRQENTEGFFFFNTLISVSVCGRS